MTNMTKKKKVLQDVCPTGNQEAGLDILWRPLSPFRVKVTLLDMLGSTSLFIEDTKPVMRCVGRRVHWIGRLANALQTEKLRNVQCKEMAGLLGSGFEIRCRPS